ncbi:MAG: methylcrotonoyl-CoA carboxylase subunit alpha [Hyphomicrobiales bacterium]|nr:methylcrotonoyl-CoA carboxylase subunit alpha [Hyphomicrobiales bacterium]
MFGSVLIANRGEIALRVLRTARRLGMRVIAIYSDADAGAPHVRLADEAHRVGPAPAAQSYLDGAAILDVARRTGAECLHPGYGFLSENADFAQACADAGLVFVGPPPSAMRDMGLKDRAKALMRAAGVPVVPGYEGARQDAAHLRAQAQAIGYPVLVKAIAGGGGKGMRRVDAPDDFDDALAGAQREAQAFFGDARVLLERYVERPRHIEMQVFADAHGEVVHLFERDCSLQRRHQKIIEEAPAPGMTEGVRAAMGAAAVAAARAVGYVGAGTVEFIVDGARGLAPDNFFFLEMNTRLQVEHPVTELATGLDLVDWQFRVAAGEPLPLRQAQISLQACAVEARLYAEDPDRGFLPSPGTLHALRLPAGVRVDAGVEQGGEVSGFYDPMIAKIIAQGATRDAALDALARALDETLAAGVRTNLALLRELVADGGFRAGDFDTGAVDRKLAGRGAPERDGEAIAFAAAAHAQMERGVAGPDPWSVPDAFQFAGPRRTPLMAAADGEPVGASVEWSAGDPVGTFDGHRCTASPEGEWWRCGPLLGVAGGDSVFVLRGGRQTQVRFPDPLERAGEEADGDGAVLSPLQGRVVSLFVQAGDVVSRGQRLAVIEAMKMEHVVLAPRSGRVHAVATNVGAQAGQGARLMTIEEGETA